MTISGSSYSRHLPSSDRRPARLPSLLVGIGMGGFVDGIVLHQMLQWHHMLTDTGEHPATTLSGLEVNTVADGIFHAATWLFVITGVTLAVRAWQQGRLAPAPSTHLGMLLAGWGIFNVVEGVIDHLLLGVHHVRDDLGGPLAWDIGFVVLGVLQVVAGVALARRRPVSVHRGRPR